MKVPGLFLLESFPVVKGDEIHAPAQVGVQRLVVESQNTEIANIQNLLNDNSLLT